MTLYKRLQTALSKPLVRAGIIALGLAVGLAGTHKPGTDEAIATGITVTPNNCTRAELKATIGNVPGHFTRFNCTDIHSGISITSITFDVPGDPVTSFVSDTCSDHTGIIPSTPQDDTVECGGIVWQFLPDDIHVK